jgi:hypothetical protein
VGGLCGVYVSASKAALAQSKIDRHNLTKGC